MIFIYPSTIYAKTVTATTDTPFQIEPSGSRDGDVILSAVNIHCFTNGAYYGNMAFQPGVILPNNVVWFDGIVKLSDIWFKNSLAGSNCVISVVGIIKR